MSLSSPTALKTCVPLGPSTTSGTEEAINSPSGSRSHFLLFISKAKKLATSWLLSFQTGNRAFSGFPMFTYFLRSKVFSIENLSLCSRQYGAKKEHTGSSKKTVFYWLWPCEKKSHHSSLSYPSPWLMRTLKLFIWKQGETVAAWQVGLKWNAVYGSVVLKLWNSSFQSNKPVADLALLIQASLCRQSRVSHISVRFPMHHVPCGT